MQILLVLTLLAATAWGQTDDKIWCPANENYLNHHGSRLDKILGIESMEACQAACDEKEGCMFVWFKAPGRLPGMCQMLGGVERFKPRLFKSRMMVYSGRLCVQDDPRVLPCHTDWNCYATDYCEPETLNCEPKCNGDTICGQCESCFDREQDDTQECRADAAKCPLTAEPTTAEPTEATEEPTEATKEPTEATEEPTTAVPTEATEEPTTLQPTAAPTASQWCPTTDKYMNHNGNKINEVTRLEDMEACKEACDNTEGCNFVWFFQKVGRRPTRCKMFEGAVFLKPRVVVDLRPITYAGRLCGVTDFKISCYRPGHCFLLDTCNYQTHVCEPGLDDPMHLPQTEEELDMVDADFVSESELGLIELLFASIGVAAVFYAVARMVMGIIFDRKSYTPVPDTQ